MSGSVSIAFFQTVPIFFISFYLDGELGDVASEDGGLTLVPRGIRISLTFRNHLALFDVFRTQKISLYAKHKPSCDIKVKI